MPTAHFMQDVLPLILVIVVRAPSVQQDKKQSSVDHENGVERRDGPAQNLHAKESHLKDSLHELLRHWAQELGMQRQRHEQQQEHAGGQQDIGRETPKHLLATA